MKRTLTSITRPCDDGYLDTYWERASVIKAIRPLSGTIARLDHLCLMSHIRIVPVMIDNAAAHIAWIIRTGRLSAESERKILDMTPAQLLDFVILIAATSPDERKQVYP